ncbi:MAG: SDR family NAD(P)-dependent oxidoreductase [Hyphomicrobiales bacterium]
MDLLLNNAGVGGPGRQAIGNIDYDAWAHVLDVNTLGPLRVSEAFVDNVASSDRKLIVTLTSGMGSIDDNTSGGAFAYRSSKAAVNMVMRSLAVDLAPRGITCLVLNPGPDRYGRAAWQSNPGREHRQDAAPDRQLRAKAIPASSSITTAANMRGRLVEIECAMRTIRAMLLVLLAPSAYAASLPKGQRRRPAPVRRQLHEMPRHRSVHPR